MHMVHNECMSARRLWDMPHGKDHRTRAGRWQQWYLTTVVVNNTVLPQGLLQQPVLVVGSWLGSWPRAAA
jgi:hypothetical protein